jgi:hypothetical protein
MGIQPTMIWLVNVILWCFKYHGTSQETSTNGRFSFARSNCWRARDIPHTFLTLSSTFDIWPPLAPHISTNIKQPGPDNLAWHRQQVARRSLPISAPAVRNLVGHVWYSDRWQLLSHLSFQYFSINRLK